MACYGHWLSWYETTILLATTIWVHPSLISAYCKRRSPMTSLLASKWFARSPSSLSIAPLSSLRTSSTCLASLPWFKGKSCLYPVLILTFKRQTTSQFLIMVYRYSMWKVHLNSWRTRLSKCSNKVTILMSTSENVTSPSKTHACTSSLSITASCNL